MWITGISVTATGKFYPQANVQEVKLFHKACGGKFSPKLSTEKFSTFHRGCGKKIEAQRNQTQNADLKTFLYPLALWQRQHHREELMLAVMSRMLFCMLVSPFFRASSTLRMA